MESRHGKWYERVPSLGSQGSVTQEGNVPSSVIQRRRVEAERVYEKACDSYSRESNERETSDGKYLRLMLKSGTVGDKISALTILIQENPEYEIQTLDSLVAMSTKKSKREAELAINALTPLFIQSLLPDRHLKYFSSQPSHLPSVKDQHLVFWTFEERLKTTFAEFVGALDEWTKDTIPHLRRTALNAAASLLKEKPEQEKALLSLVIEKFADSEKKIASSTVSLLSDVVRVHGNMKDIVVRAVKSFLRRSELSARAKYYAVVLLSQIDLTPKDSETASLLLSMYFSLFHSEQKAADSQEHFPRLLGALLTGLKKAMTLTNATVSETDVSCLFRVARKSESAVWSLQALSLLLQVFDAPGKPKDRVYRAIYERLLSDDIRNVSRPFLLLSILGTAIKSDDSFPRVAALAKRTLQLAIEGIPSFSCAVLLLISDIMKVKPELRALVVQPEVEGEEEFFDVDESPPSKKMKIESNDEAGYDPMKRDPSYSSADNSCLWELSLLAKSYHPSVRIWADTILSGGTIEYSGSPLEDFSLTKFLDRFAQKKAKKQREKDDSSKKNSKKRGDNTNSGLPEEDQFLRRYERLCRKREEDMSALDVEDDDSTDEDDDTDEANSQELEAKVAKEMVKDAEEEFEGKAIEEDSSNVFAAVEDYEHML